MTKNRGLTLHRNGKASIDGVEVGEWAPLPWSTGYSFSCTYGAGIQRFGLGELREKIEIHLDSTQHSVHTNIFPLRRRS